MVEPKSQKYQARELWNPFHLLYSEKGKNTVEHDCSGSTYFN